MKQNNQPAEQMKKKPDPVIPEEEKPIELSGEELEKIAGGQNSAPQSPEYVAPSGTFL